MVACVFCMHCIDSKHSQDSRRSAADVRTAHPAYVMRRECVDGVRYSILGPKIIHCSEEKSEGHDFMAFRKTEISVRLSVRHLNDPCDQLSLTKTLANEWIGASEP